MTALLVRIDEMQTLQTLRGREAGQKSPDLQHGLRALRGAPAAERLGFAGAAQGALGCNSPQAGRAGKVGRPRAGESRASLMFCVIGPRFADVMPRRDRPVRIEEMLAALVACDEGLMTPAGIDGAVGVRRTGSASGFAVAKRLGLIAPLASGVPLYKVSPLGETVLRFLDAEA